MRVFFITGSGLSAESGRVAALAASGEAASQAVGVAVVDALHRRGPLVETEGPSYRYRNAGMDERREVVGDWTPPIVRDRRHEPSGHPPQGKDQPEAENN